MYLINDKTKQVLFSRGKNATTSIADGIRKSDPDWYEIPGIDAEGTSKFAPYKDYTCYIFFRDPYQRYISGLLEDIETIMKSNVHRLNYTQHVINNTDLQVLGVKHISNNKDAILWVDRDEEYFEHVLHIISDFTKNDMSIGNSFHCSNWLWESLCLHTLFDKTVFIDLPNIDSYMLKHFNLKMNHENMKSHKDKETLMRVINNSQLGFKERINEYLEPERKLYNLIINNRNTDFLLKDFKENPELAVEVFWAMTTEYDRALANSFGEGRRMMQTFLKLLLIRNWDRK